MVGMPSGQIISTFTFHFFLEVLLYPVPSAPEKWWRRSDPQETLAKTDCEADAEGQHREHSLNTVLCSDILTGEQRVTVGDRGFSPAQKLLESRRGCLKARDWRHSLVTSV